MYLLGMINILYAAVLFCGHGVAKIMIACIIVILTINLMLRAISKRVVSGASADTLSKALLDTENESSTDRSSLSVAFGDNV